MPSSSSRKRNDELLLGNDSPLAVGFSLFTYLLNESVHKQPQTACAVHG